MTTQSLLCDRLSDDELLKEVKRRCERERQCTAELIASLMELDARKLYLSQGCSSLFTYCTHVLHLSEHAAYGRIEAARAARRFPVILDRLGDGSVTLTAIGLLAPLLTPENHLEVLDAARHKSKREIEHLVAERRPRPDVAAAVRKLPDAKPTLAARTDDAGKPTVGVASCEAVSHTATAIVPNSSRAEVKPLAPARYKVQFTVDRGTYEKLRRAQDLLRHAIPTGDPDEIFARALTLLVADLERKKLAATHRPREARANDSSSSRYIPAAVKRAVWRRDEGRCAFVGAQGRCRETGFLEFHHVVPYAAGGETSVENLELRCRSHNVYEAREYLGREDLFALPDAT